MSPLPRYSRKSCPHLRYYRGNFTKKFHRYHGFPADYHGFTAVISPRQLSSSVHVLQTNLRTDACVECRSTRVVTRWDSRIWRRCLAQHCCGLQAVSHSPRLWNNCSALLHTRLQCRPPSYTSCCWWSAKASGSNCSQIILLVVEFLLSLLTLFLPFPPIPTLFIFWFHLVDLADLCQLLNAH